MAFKTIKLVVQTPPQLFKIEVWACLVPIKIGFSVEKSENLAKRFLHQLDFFHRCFSRNPKYNYRAIFLVGLLSLDS
jgi:hypothetical protein